MTTVLITGTGANIGYGAVRLFKSLKQNIRVIATDINADAVGQHWADAFHQVPLTASKDYSALISSLIQRYKIKLIVPCIEQDVAHFNSNRHVYGAPVVLNNPKLIKLCADKWEFNQHLASIHPEMAILSSMQPLPDYPFLLKPRIGYAGKGQFRVRNLADLKTLRPLLGDTHFAQRLVGSDDEEFTVATYGDGDGGSCAAIVMRRTLAPDGSTKSARVERNAKIEEAVDRLTASFKPYGPTNFQFRIDENLPLLLEINPRLSSTLSLRAAFGFNDCEMIVQHYLKNRLPEAPTIRSGFGIRYTEDLIVSISDNF